MLLEPFVGRNTFNDKLISNTYQGLHFGCWGVASLIPKLPPQSVIILDNASFHKGSSMKKALESSGRTWFIYLGIAQT